MINGYRLPVIAAAILIAGVFHSPGAAGVTEMKQGEGGSTVQGSAGPGGSEGDSGLEHCNEPMGALAVVEPQSYVQAALAQYDLQSPTGLIRMMVQQSNCFIVVERGQGMNNMMQERALADSGELRQGSNYGGGQMVAADFVLTPSVVFSDDNAGGIGGALGGLIGGTSGAVLGGIAGGLKFQEAQTSMLVSDARTGVQVAAAEGSAEKADLSLGGFMYGSGVGGGLGGYSSTDEGKVIAASLADNYNNIVRAVRGQPTLHRDVGSLAQESAAGGQQGGGPSFIAGDVLWPKINNVKLMSEPSDEGNIIAKLPKSEEMIFMGGEQDGFVQVETGQGGGWVKKILVTR